MQRTVLLGMTAILVVALLAAAVFHDAIIAAAIRGVAASYGYRVAFARLHTGLDAAEATGIDVTNRAGEPVFEASRIALRYSLRDLLPGSRHRFGLTAIDVERPKLVLIHHADGTYNVSLPAGSRASSKPDTTPIDLRARIRDGSVLLVDRFVEPGHERRQRIVGLALDARLGPDVHSFYNARFDLDDGHTLYPVVGKATFAANRGFESQRWTAATLPIGPLIDFALPSHAIALVDGELDGVDARIYTFVDPDGTTHTHVGIRAQLRDGKLYVAALREPLRGAAGPIRAYDDGLTTTGIDATLAGVPLHLRGGIFNLGSPQVRFALTGGGSLDELRQITTATQRLPVAGTLGFAFRAVGNATSPLIFGRFNAPALDYGAYRIDRPQGTIAVQGTQLDILGASLAYGPLVATARGSVDLGHAITTNLVATVAGDGDALPYVPQLVRGMQLGAVVHVSGTGARLATNGVVYGRGSGGSLNGLLALDGGGNGVIGPLAIQRNDGASLYARIAVDRRRGSAAGIVSARHFSLLPALPATLPGIDVAALPAIGGTIDAARAGAVDGQRLCAASGHLAISGLRVGAVTGSANADIGDAPHGGGQRARVVVRTNVADLDGTAAADPAGTFAVDGRLHTSFERLRAIAPGLDARGDIDVPLRAVGDGTSTAVQIASARFIGASVHGVALRDADATVVIRDGNAEVRAARIGLDGGTIVAAGRAGSDDVDLAAVTSALPLRPLAGASVPIDAGTLRATVLARGPLRAPRAEITLETAGVRVHGLAIAANADATYDDGTLQIADANALAGDGSLAANGSVRDLAGGHPVVDLTAHVRGAQIAQLDRVVHLPLPYPDGEIDADAHAQGALASPQLTADVRIPNGSVNELGFRNAHVALSGDLANVAARGGTVTVGSTVVTFSGDLSRASQRIEVRAPHVDLTDFDNYFDTADAIGGRGHLALTAAASPTGVQTTGDVAIADARFHRFAVGTTSANWTTRARTIDATASVRGAHGNAELTAAATLPASAPLRDPAHRITLDANGSLGAFDVASWLPAAGIQAPVAGIIAGSARAHGTLAAPTVAVTAALTNGAAAGYHITTLTLAVDGNAQRAHIASLHFVGPGLTADLSGTAGYGAHDPIALALHATSDDLPTLERAAGLKLIVGGSASTTIDLSGTRVSPRIAQTLDATNLTADHYTVPRVHASASADERTLRLDAFEADLTKGRVLASATVPITFAPPRIGVRDAPLAAMLRADAIDLSQFAALLPDHSKVTGTIDGEIAASGTPQDPAIDGSLALTGGTYASDLVRSAIDNARARLTFTRATAQLSGVHADVGGGSIDGSGTMTFGDARDFAHTFALNAQLTASNARLDVNRYLTGTVNGTITATKTPGRRDAVIGGDVAFSKTRIPLTALLSSSKANPQATPVALPVAFALTVSAGNDVRVQGSGVDVGARGAVTVGGTLAAPTLDGSLQSTDGTLSLYRTFTLQRGVVTFAPSDGLIPDVDATATTTITNPDTDILLHVTGPVTNLNLDLASNPSYSKEQILGLLLNAQAFGAVQGVQTTQTSGGGINAANIAGGYLSSQLSQSLLAPIGSQLGSSLGFSDLALGYDYGSGFSAGASRPIGKNLTASFHQTFGTDQREVLGLAYQLHRNAALQFSLFNAGNQSPSIVASGTFLGSQDPFTPVNYTLQAFQPPPGVSGYVFTYQRKF
jgi:autotransporter translocation and assembly factor TamB